MRRLIIKLTLTVFLFTIIAIGSIGGCGSGGGGGPRPTPSPTPTAGPPTPTPVPTVTPVPTPTPTGGPTPSPTPIASPTPTPTPTPEPPDCEDVPSRFDDDFLEQFIVTYLGETGMSEEVLALLTKEGASCQIAISTVVPNIGDVAGTLMGNITPDGTMCDFAGTTFELILPVETSLDIISGKATLSDGGNVLTFSDIVVIINNDEVEIAGVETTCQLVEPLEP